MPQFNTPLYGYYEGADNVTLVERPVWRVLDDNKEVVALCLSEEDARLVAAALNEFALT